MIVFGCVLTGFVDNHSVQAEEYRKNLFELIETFVYRLVRPWLYSDFVYAVLGYQRREDKLLEPIHKFTRSVIDKRRAMFYETQASLEDLQNENM